MFSGLSRARVFANRIDELVGLVREAFTSAGCLPRTGSRPIRCAVEPEADDLRYGLARKAAPLLRVAPGALGALKPDENYAANPAAHDGSKRLKMAA